MKKRLSFLLTLGVLLACNTNDNVNIIENKESFLIFGHFYGMCFGEGCVETYKLNDKKLYEDIIDDYLGQELDFVELDNDTFEQVKNLPDFFPSQLLNDPETIFGCPDCADGGGLFIIYSENGITSTWRIDQDKANVPIYLHNFMDKVNEKIQIINN